MTRTIRIGISTCPNDTFAFHGLLTRAVDWRGLRFEVELLDIEQLNERLLAGHYDACKASFAAALEVAADVVVLPSGSALGFGVGPLLLAARSGSRPRDPRQLTVCPGRHTTAALPRMRAHAQEFDDRVLMQHVELYVNDWTVDLGPVGRRALDEFSSRATAAGRGSGCRLAIFGE